MVFFCLLACLLVFIWKLGQFLWIGLHIRCFSFFFVLNYFCELCRAGMRLTCSLLLGYIREYFIAGMINSTNLIYSPDRRPKGWKNRPLVSISFAIALICLQASCKKAFFLLVILAFAMEGKQQMQSFSWNAIWSNAGNLTTLSKKIFFQLGCELSQAGVRWISAWRWSGLLGMFQVVQS